MEVLLVRNEVPTRFLGVLELLKFNYKDVVELLEVLSHIVDFYSAGGFELQLLNFSVHEGLE